MAAPANDNIANAQVLANGTTQVTGDSTEATVESGELRLNSDSTTSTAAAVRTVWFKWWAPSVSSATITTVGSTFDTYLSLYRSNTPTPTAYTQLVPVASDDDTGGSTSSVTFVPETAGTPYWVQISGFGGTDSGPYTLNYPSPAVADGVLFARGRSVGYISQVANDLLMQAQVLGVGTTQTTGDTEPAEIEPGEVRGANSGTSPSTSVHSTVWFRWVAPSGSSATITTVGSDFDTYLTIFQAKSGVVEPVFLVTDLEIVASDDDGGGSRTSSVTFTPTSGRTYFVQISGYDEDEYGPYTLNYPSPGSGSGSTQDAAGTAAGVAGASGAAAADRAVTGAVAGTAGASGAAAAVRAVTGAVAGTAAGTGTAAAVRAVSATSAATASAAAGSAGDQVAAGTAAGDGGAAGTSTRTTTATATSATSGAAAGTAAAARAASATSTSSAAASGVSARTTAAAATVTGSSTAAGTASRTSAAAGTVTATATSAATATTGSGSAGTATATSSASGACTAARAATAAAASVGGASGTATLVPGPAAAAATWVAATVGSLAVIRSVTGDTVWMAAGGGLASVDSPTVPGPDTGGGFSGYGFGGLLWMDTETIFVIDGPRLNQYGDPMSSTTETTVAGCLFAPGATNDVVDHSEQARTKATVYAPAGTIVRHDQHVRIRGELYQVDGDVQVWASEGVVIPLNRVTG